MTDLCFPPSTSLFSVCTYPLLFLKYHSKYRKLFQQCNTCEFHSRLRLLPMAAADVMRRGVRRVRAQHHHAELRAARRGVRLPPHLQHQGTAYCHASYWLV